MDQKLNGTESDDKWPDGNPETKTLMGGPMCIHTNLHEKDGRNQKNVEAEMLDIDLESDSKFSDGNPEQKILTGGPMYIHTNLHEKDGRNEKNTEAEMRDIEPASAGSDDCLDEKLEQKSNSQNTSAQIQKEGRYQEKTLSETTTDSVRRLQSFGEAYDDDILAK